MCASTCSCIYSHNFCSLYTGYVCGRGLNGHRRTFHRVLAIVLRSGVVQAFCVKNAIGKQSQIFKWKVRSQFHLAPAYINDCPLDAYCYRGKTLSILGSLWLRASYNEVLGCLYSMIQFITTWPLTHTLAKFMRIRLFQMQKWGYCWARWELLFIVNFDH